MDSFPGSAGFQPAREKQAGKMPALPGEEKKQAGKRAARPGEEAGRRNITVVRRAGFTSLGVRASSPQRKKKQAGRMPASQGEEKKQAAKMPASGEIKQAGKMAAPRGEGEEIEDVTCGDGLTPLSV